MMVRLSSDMRGKLWSKDKDRALERISSTIDEWVEELVSQAIQDYIESDQFCSDASEYCREQGWREPA